MPEEDRQCTEIEFYGLSTCMWCKKTKAILDSKNLDYTHIFVNELPDDEKENVKARVKELNPANTYPTVKIGDQVIVGHHPEQLEEAIAECHPKVK